MCFGKLRLKREPLKASVKVVETIQHTLVVIVVHIYPTVTCTCSEVSCNPLMFLWISLNSFSLNLLFVRSHQTLIIIVKRQRDQSTGGTRIMRSGSS